MFRSSTLSFMANPLRRLAMSMTPSGRDVLRAYDSTEGLLAIREAAWIYRRARRARTIVEIGSFRGRSCVLLAKGSQRIGGRITAIDPHRPSGDGSFMNFMEEDNRRFHDAVARHHVAERVTKIVADSRSALAKWDGRPIDLLWIDGDHSYEGAKFDIQAWGALVGPGGWMLAHDYGRFPGVTQAWDEIVTSKQGWGATTLVRTIASAQRRA